MDSASHSAVRGSLLSAFSVPATLLSLTAALTIVFDGTRPPAPAGTSAAWTKLPKRSSHVDHSTFFREKLESGRSVTKRCLVCHKKSGHELLNSAHFRWEGPKVKIPGHEREFAIGKRNVINNFCIGVQGGNWPACTKCHAGYGWDSADYDFSDALNIDCLVCHEHSGSYEKGLAGQPKTGTDLNAVAASVGTPTRNNCGNCHFAGGGGDAVKHGDLDGTLLNPNERLDVHMGRHDFMCVDCHRTQHHKMAGRAMSVSVDDQNRARCSDCHGGVVHSDGRLERHTHAVACETCHIPSMALDAPTKMSWDWSQAGDKERETQTADAHRYLAIKGSFEFGNDVAPEYSWWNGTTERYLVGDKIDPKATTLIAGPLGDISERRAKLHPFKVHRGKQIYDVKYLYFIVPKTFGTDGYWNTFDWRSAADLGCRNSDLECSGEYDFAPTVMYWPLEHMVQAKGKALDCADCHGARGRLDWEELGYSGDPLTLGGRERQGLLR